MKRRVLFGMIWFAVAAHAAPPLPERLDDTGLRALETLTFTPQYPLWSDGTRKRRWLHLPPNSAIDASRPDAWDFPPGTRAWKEFSTGRRVETRFIERLADGSWRFAAYVWNAEGTDARLAPERGIAALPVADAPDGRYAIPSRADCLACHGAAPAPLLGVSALQLSPERDPLAPNAERARAEDTDLRSLAAAGRIRNLPPELLASAPRVGAPNPTSRAALGYLHANCGHCHNDTGPLANVELALAQQAAAPRDSVERALRTLAARIEDVSRRVHATNPYVRMPPLGTRQPDLEALALLERWIRHDFPSTQKESTK